ncbi:MAG: D-mannonate epimerase, partial [Calditrichaeota bacterium]|nr:D-mannonate epimerase [Calditrichota bacterium]
MLYYSRGSTTDELQVPDLMTGLFAAFDKIAAAGKVLAVPPDFTRYHSFAGLLTRMAYEYYGKQLTDILPALGTH